MGLGAGRQTVDDAIDHSAGITLSAKVGDAVSYGDLLATLRFNASGNVEAAMARVMAAFRIEAVAPHPWPLILDEIG